MNILFQILALLIAAWVMVKATELVINNLNSLSKEMSWGKFGVAALLATASTSFPELFVGITSALSGSPSLSLGNVIGSNIANTSLVIGLAAVVSGFISIRGEYMKRDLAYAFLVGAIPLVLLSDGRLNRLEGLSLIVGYILYVRHVLRRQMRGKTEEHVRKVQGRFWQGIGLSWAGEGQTGKSIGKLLFGMAVIILSAEVIVRMGSGIAESLHISRLLVGLFVIALGTSLPELSLWVREAMKREGEFVFGNLTGSLMANSLLVVGVTAVIAPIEVIAVESYFIGAVAYVVLFWSFWFLTSSNKRLYRWEGALLVTLYLIFVIVEFSKENGYGLWLRSNFDKLWELVRPFI